MRRWHSPRERAIMLRRRRDEIDSRERLFGSGLAPLQADRCDVSRHRDRGIGLMRKRRAFGCGNARCGVCHFEKLFVPKARAAKRQSAIDFDLAASG